MLQHRLATARFFSCGGVWDFGVMASRGSVFWVLSALTLCSKFVGGTAFEARVGWDGLEVLSTTADSTGKNAASFRVGREKAVADKPFSRDVNWPADDLWKQTSNDIAQTTGITFVRVYDSGRTDLRYILQFFTTKTYDYSFQAESGESSEVTYATPGLNTLKYEAKKPTIVKVTGN